MNTLKIYEFATENPMVPGPYGTRGSVVGGEPSPGSLEILPKLLYLFFLELAHFPGMWSNLKYPIRDLLSGVTTGGATQPQLADLNGLCQRMALTYLRRKIAAGKINPSVLGLNDRDLALDCVAELFAPSPDGRFIEFIDYFEAKSVDIPGTPERMLLVHLRRLVFYICNDGIFRMYGEADPSLSRIIRNIKLGLKRSTALRTMMRFDEQLIVTVSAEAGSHIPVMTHDEVQLLVDGNLDIRTGIPGLLGNIAREIGGRVPTAKAVPLISLACCVRAACLRLNIREAAADEDPMLTDDVRTIIRDACNRIMALSGSKYLVKGKVCKATMEGYISGIGKLLEAEFLGQSDGESRYFDFFTSALPGVSREEYAGIHRPVFEYLTKLARTRALRGLREL